MENKVKVSVIMPSLNVRDYIEAALESAINQKLKEIEILCIDAGSTDGTWDIISDYSKKDGRIKALKSSIKSYGYQVNMGIEYATGEYIAILETDDYVSEEMYNALYEQAQKNELDYVKCDYYSYITEKNGHKKYSERHICNDHFFYENIFRPSDYPNVMIEDWYLWNGIYKTQFIKNKGIKFSETAGAAFQDVGFLHRVSVVASKGMFFGEPLYYYCVDREGASSNSNKALIFIRQEYGILENEIDENTIPSTLILLYRRMARSFLRACLESSDELLKKQEYSDICLWFKNVLANAERRGYISEADLPYGLIKAYYHLIDSVDSFILYRRNRYEELLGFLKDNNVLVIFGCGSYGKEALHLVTSLGCKVYCFMDNSEKLWGESINNIKILASTHITELPQNTSFIVANEKYADDIEKQIRGYRKKAKMFCFTSELVYTNDYKNRRVH